MDDKKYLILVYNRSSGSKQQHPLLKQIVAQLQNAGQHIFLMAMSHTFLKDCTDFVSQLDSQNVTLVAMGGDGTIRTVAQFCYENKFPMGIIPCGTFNYFARSLGISTDPILACQQFIKGHSEPVPIGVLNGTVFVNNASFGLYTHLIKQRELDNKTYGRYQLIGILSGIKALLSYKGFFAVEFHDQQTDQKTAYKTSLFFVGNNVLQLEALKLPSANDVTDTTFAVIIMSVTTWVGRIKVILHGLLWKMWSKALIEEKSASNFQIKVQKQQLKVALDGEIFHFQTPLTFVKDSTTVHVIRPVSGDSEGGRGGSVANEQKV